MKRSYRILYAILAPVLRLLFGIKVTDAYKIPEGGFLMCANHTALADVFVLSVASRKQIRYMAKKELFSIPVLKSLIRALGAYPVDRGGADVDSIKNTIKLLEDGEVVGIFPQGTRHPGEDPRSTKVKSGIGMVAWHSKADVLPVFIRAKGNKVRLFRRNEVIFGDIIKNSELGFEHGGIAEYRNASQYVFDRICDLSSDNKPNGAEDAK